MRRKDFIFEDRKEMEIMLNKIEFGVMAIPDKIPYAVPISFCYKDNEIYFHGAMAGRKHEILKNNPEVSFTASKVYSYIPSSFLNGKMTPTQFFFSIFIEGKFEVVNDFEKKKKILCELVKKYEPENINMSMDKGQFKGSEIHTFVGIIKIYNMTAKAKFGQNMSDSDINIIINDLKNRNAKIDIETIEMINKLRDKNI